MRALFSLLLLMPTVMLGQDVPAEQEPARPAPPPAEVAIKPPESAVTPGMFLGTTIRREQFQPLTGTERWRLYVRQTYLRPGAVFRALGPAAGGQMNNEPPEWGQGMKGYSKRVADRFGRFTIQDSLTAAGSAALGYDVRYVKCDCKGFFPRFSHAIAWNFLTLDRNGKTVFNSPRVGAAFASEFIGNTWMPKDYRTTSEAIRGVGVQLAVGSLFNTIREFIPQKKRK